MSLRHTLLGILGWVPAHGYALREMARDLAWIHPMTNANLYPALRELEAEGFVRHTEEVHDGRLRKVYNLTEAGHAELRRWLADATPERGTFRDPTLLKLCFLREDDAPEGAEAWIAEEATRCAEVAERAERYLKEGGGEQLPKYTRLVAEHGRDLARLRAQWLARVLDEVQREPEAETEAP
jgi:DNA-binding PadR family transcriptional regulator